MPTIPEAYASAVEHFRAGDLERAEWICGQIVEAAPDYADAWYFRGLVSQALGKPELAVDYLRRALAITPDDEEALNNLGVVLCDRGDTQQAIACLRRAVELRPDYAEAHHNLGVALRARGSPDEAVVCYRRALRLAPGYAEAHMSLGNLLGWRGELGQAVECYRRVLEIDPESAVARHMLAACTGADVPARAPDAYIRRLFGRSAGGFDAVLGRLGYRAPSLVAAALCAEHPRPARALDVLDAGCGTGLCGPLLRPHARRLVGVDLSSAMLEQARRRDAYDDLVEAELTAYLGGLRAAFDVVVSADTLVYFGALEGVLAAAARALRSGGLLVFSVERALDTAEGAGFQVDRSGRYRHRQDYVERSLAREGLTLRRIAGEALRRERGEPVEGLVVTARKPGAADRQPGSITTL